MCYSFEASIVAAFGLAIVGGFAVYKAVRCDRRMAISASFPVTFLVQKLVESVVWHSLAHPFAAVQTYQYIYTIIAFLLWPVLTPLAAAAAKNDVRRKRLWLCMRPLSPLRLRRQ